MNSRNKYLHYNNGEESETGLYNHTWLWINGKNELFLYSQSGKRISKNKLNCNNLQEYKICNEPIKDAIKIFYCPMCRS